MTTVPGIVDRIRSKLQIQREHLMGRRHVDLLLQNILSELIGLLNALRLQISSLLSQQELRRGSLVGSILVLLLSPLDRSLQLFVFEFLFGQEQVVC